MLKDDRLAKIVELINRHKTLKTDQIAESLDISLATVRRDLNELDEAKKIKKIFGGAKSIVIADYVTTEDAMDTKMSVKIQEKILIGQLAAQQIKENDFVYMDAGSSVEAMISFINTTNVTFVTNSIGIARDLSARNYKVFILPGEIKLSTDSIIGIAASEYLRRFNFTVGYFGTNGLHKEFGFTTPDINEAMVKTAAIERCKEVMILADDSKVGKVSQVTFCHDAEAKIITNQFIDGTEQAIMTTLEEEL